MCSSGTPAVHLPPFALDTETPADHIERPALALLPTTSDWWQTSCGTPRVEPRPLTRAHASSTPSHHSPAPKQLRRRRSSSCRESAAEALPRRSSRTSCVQAPARRRGGGRERWHQLAAARPHVGEAVPRTRRRRRRRGPASVRRGAAVSLQIAVARPVDARHRRVVEPQGAARAAPQAHRVNRRRRITLLILPAEFFPECRESRAHRTFVAVPRPDRVSSSRRDCVPGHAWRIDSHVSSVYPLT